MTDPADPTQGDAAMIEAPETPHTPHGHHHDSGGQRWFDIAMALAVLLVSAGSLYVALHTGKTMEELVHANERLVRAQSTPVLQYDHGNISEDGKEQLEFSITNVGTGPARIVWFEAMPKGARYSSVGTWIVATGDSSITFTSASINRMVLAPGVQRRMVTWKRPTDEAGRKRWSLIDRARFETPVRACYCSVFDQCWVSNLEADIPQEVPNCQRKGDATPENALAS